MISQLFAALSDSESDELVEKIFAGTIVFDNRVNPKPKYELTNPIMIDEAFAGQLMTMYAALWFVLKANFQDFIDAASKLQGGAGEAVAAVVASAST
jgi:hypothetical protein